MDGSLRKKQKMDDLEVTGVSRSGRVRKKSSKLMDFESPDEIDRPYKKQPVAARKLNTDSPNSLSDLQPKKDATQLQQQRHALKMEEDVNVEDHQFRDDPNDSNTSDYEANDPYSNRSHTMSTDSLDSEQSDMDTSVNTSQTITGSSTQVVDNGQFQKLTDTNDALLVEGSSMQIVSGQGVGHLGQQELAQAKNKRLVIKDGRIVSRTSNQAAKGGQPRKIADKAGHRAQHTATPATPSSSTPTHHHQVKKHPAATPAASKPFNTSVGQRNRASSQLQSPNKSPVYQLGLPTVGGNASAGVSPPSPRGGVTTSHKNEHMFKVNGIKPIDVAAHLKLLGESLTIIGERLKEHEGQIAVSGSLSVLLDSLLCALGPLLCLTQQIPELQENCCDPDQLTSTLDNVAFIMPGL